MKFCTEHWAQLRAGIDSRGLGALVADSGEQLARNLTGELAEGLTVDNFDPLWAAHNAIVGMAMTLIKQRYQQNPLMVMADADEHPEWACPICALLWCHAEHDRLCTQEGCNYPKAYDWAADMVTGAADHVLAEWRALRP